MSGGVIAQLGRLGSGKGLIIGLKGKLVPCRFPWAKKFNTGVGYGILRSWFEEWEKS